ncbi:MAG TPA: crotonase/enoyl-CoA hydratase family protein [Acidimicrobiia bacterium]
MRVLRHIEVERREGVGFIWLNRPDKRNALSEDMWEDLPRAANELASDPAVRVVVVAGRGPAFTVGIDLDMLGTMEPEGDSPVERRRNLYRRIAHLQGSFSALSDCPQPVIAAVNGYCLGAGIDLITACDLRLASADAVFGVRETVMGLVADVGTLPRLPRTVGAAYAAELVFTGEDIDADRAAAIGLVNRVFPTVEALHQETAILASRIAANSPLVVQGAKAVMRASEGRTVAEALDYVALWNSSFLQSEDLAEALTAFAEKRAPRFRGL